LAVNEHFRNISKKKYWIPFHFVKMSTLANHIFKLHVIQHEQKLNEDHVVIEHLSENAPAENEPIRTPPMSAVDAN